MLRKDAPLAESFGLEGGAQSDAKDEVRLEFAADTVHLAELGEFLQAACAGHPQLILIELAITEVVVNAIKHGDAARIRVSVRTRRDTFDIEVVDDGKAFDITQVQPAPLGELREHGYGLGIIHRAAKHLSYTRSDELSRLLLRFSR